MYCTPVRNPHEQLDRDFVQLATILAQSYGLSIDWETSDYNKRILNFVGDPGDEQVQEFILALMDRLDNAIVD